ncbi:MAG TPA: hypothetical protein VG841_13155 [Caulobacterales bacterium]|nr:hypothetical protein [Caulobacterales bacterium]
MRFRSLLAALALAGCVTAGPAPNVQRATLTPADAATGLMTGGALAMTLSSPAAAPSAGQDGLVQMRLTTTDGRALAFTEANHAPFDVMAQAQGGPLAQVMGLFGEEAPKLYAADAANNAGAPFLCGPQGPAYVGIYDAPDGTAQIVALRSGFEFEADANGAYTPVPFSPDHVCARMRFRKG